MKQFSILISLFYSSFLIGQITTIPDPIFEQRLINIGLDTGVINGSVPTPNIDTVTSLLAWGLSISDLTGIEDFTALTYLDVKYNQLTSLNVTQNLLLEHLECSTNNLASLDVTQNSVLNFLSCVENQFVGLDVTQNSLLVHLNCHSNLLTNLDVSQNPLLDLLRCEENQLTSMDVSANPNLIRLHFYNNNLTCLNVKNGNNVNFVYFYAESNPSLTCIEVDSVSYSNTTWPLFPGSFKFDTGSFFSTNCNNPCSNIITANNEPNLNDNVTIYPNPTTGNITIDLEEITSNISISLTNYLGQVVFTKNYLSTDQIKLDINAPKGIYILRLESDKEEVVTRKIIK